MYMNLSQMNGLCGGVGGVPSGSGAGGASVATAAYVQDRTSIMSGGSASGSGVSGSVVGGGGGTGSPSSRRGVSSIPANIGGPEAVRKSRSQGGKKLQKCLSTASYGEESSMNRPQLTPLSHNLLMTRQFCSFGSTTSSCLTSHIFFLLTHISNMFSFSKHFEFFYFLISFNCKIFTNIVGPGGQFSPSSYSQYFSTLDFQVTFLFPPP